jgi:uncharacterized ferritin-like protein (DUF455 family)
MGAPCAQASSLAARLAVVPCMQEARGLDAGPRLASKLQAPTTPQPHNPVTLIPNP